MGVVWGYFSPPGDKDGNYNLVSSFCLSTETSQKENIHTQYTECPSKESHSSLTFLTHVGKKNMKLHLKYCKIVYLQKSRCNNLLSLLLKIIKNIQIYIWGFVKFMEKLKHSG